MTHFSKLKGQLKLFISGQYSSPLVSFIDISLMPHWYVNTHNVRQGLCLYYIGGVNVQLVEHTRLLGIILSQKKSVQCDSVASQGLKRVFLLSNSFHSSNISTIISLYTTYVRPILEYCTPAWLLYLLRDIDQLESVHRFFTSSLPGMSQLTTVQ